MRLSRLAKIMVPISIVGLALAGCGNKTVHHKAESQSTSKPSYTIKRKKPSTKAEDGGTKTVNTKQPSTSFPKNNYVAAKPSSSASAKKQSNNIHNINKNQRKYAKRAVNETRTSGDSDDEAPTVDLGDGITAHEDRGAGQVYVSYNIGRWKILVHGNSINEAEDTAKEKALGLDQWAQSHTLPIPKTSGSLVYNVNGDDATATWNSNSGQHTLHGTLASVLAQASK